MEDNLTDFEHRALQEREAASHAAYPRARVAADSQATFTPMLFGVALAILLTFLLHETGPKAGDRSVPSTTLAAN